MELIKIDDTDIILQDEGNGRGKITISNVWGYNYSHFWGAMGMPLKEFLLSINESYFIDKLSSPFDRGVFDGKGTIRNVRKFIRTDFEIPWYQHMSAQKELREFLKDMESIESENEFVDKMSNISDDLSLFNLSREDEKEFRDALKSLEIEPWRFIETGPSHEYLFLKKLFPKLQKKIKNG